MDSRHGAVGKKLVDIPLLILQLGSNLDFEWRRWKRVLQIEGVATDLNANVKIKPAELYRRIYHMQLPEEIKMQCSGTVEGDGNDGDGGNDGE